MTSLSSVLLVDDDATTNFLNTHLLKSLSVTSVVLVARNGEEALTTLAENCVPAGNSCPRLILLNINMPVMNGIEFLEAYHPQLPAVVIALTTTSNPDDLHRLQELEVTDIISKPPQQGKSSSHYEAVFLIASKAGLQSSPQHQIACGLRD